MHIKQGKGKRRKCLTCMVSNSLTFEQLSGKSLKLSTGQHVFIILQIVSLDQAVGKLYHIEIRNQFSDFKM